jgi:hypothetical protein
LPSEDINFWDMDTEGEVGLLVRYQNANRSDAHTPSFFPSKVMGESSSGPEADVARSAELITPGSQQRSAELVTPGSEERSAELITPGSQKPGHPPFLSTSQFLCFKCCVTCQLLAGCCVGEVLWGPLPPVGFPSYV